MWEVYDEGGEAAIVVSAAVVWLFGIPRLGTGLLRFGRLVCLDSNILIIDASLRRVSHRSLSLRPVNRPDQYANGIASCMAPGCSAIGCGAGAASLIVVEELSCGSSSGICFVAGCFILCLSLDLLALLALEEVLILRSDVKDTRDRDAVRFEKTAMVLDLGTRVSGAAVTRLELPPTARTRPLSRPNPSPPDCCCLTTCPGA